MNKNYLLIVMLWLSTFSLTAQITLTQSIDPVTINTNGNACDDDTNGQYNDNYFYRVYNLTSLGVTRDFQISSVQFGQGNGTSTGKQIELRIYTATSEDLTNATLTLVGGTTHTCNAADNLKLITKPLSLIVSAGSIVVFEIYAADSGINTNQNFYPGFNTLGENDDSYLKASECGFSNPTTLTTIGLPNERYVMNVVGDEVLGILDLEASKVSITPNPTSSFINIELKESNRLKDSKIYSVTGQLVYKGGQSERLDVSHLKSGVYILELYTESGKINRKIVKR